MTLKLFLRRPPEYYDNWYHTQYKWGKDQIQGRESLHQLNLYLQSQALFVTNNQEFLSVQ